MERASDKNSYFTLHPVASREPVFVSAADYVEPPSFENNKSIVYAPSCAPFIAYLF